MRGIINGMRLAFVTAAVATAAATAPAATAPQDTPAPAIPIDPVVGILEAFKTHDIVVLGEGPHGNEQGHAFRVALIRDPRFAAVVDDVVVEFGTSRYQALMDRFIAGNTVDEAMLHRAWQDTTVVTPVWDVPIYEAFFRAVRDVNLARERQLRVLLGDAPIDWSTTRTRGDVHRWGLQKGRHTAEVIRRDVLAKHRKALVIFGDSHFQGRGVHDDRLPINILEHAPTRARIFTVGTVFGSLIEVQDDVQGWPAPSLTLLRGTRIGARPLASFYPIPPAPGWNLLTMQDEYDALLYLGQARPTFSRLTKAQCEDHGYLTMRLHRLALNVPQVAQAGVDDLTRYCDGLTAN